jgi:predicted nucleotidyltransferase component of viral defense system
MAAYQNSLITLHEDIDFFREAVFYTAGRTELNAALVEKDYYCSILLAYLYQNEETPLVFKGGTSLGKIHANFYRLSEDLDLVISMPSNALRSERRRAIAPVKKWVTRIPDEISAFGLPEGIRGHNNSKQYIANVTYNSEVAINDEPAKIKIEVGLREKLLVPPIHGKVRTLLINPFTKSPAVPEFTVMALALEEAYAEKIRAALTRREPAIRDFYDVDFAVGRLNLDLKNHRLIKLVTDKLKVPDNKPIDISPSRKEKLQAQLDTQLKPVLRPLDFEKFNLDRAFELVAKLGARIRA